MNAEKKIPDNGNVWLLFFVQSHTKWVEGIPPRNQSVAYVL